jgi:ABC-type branched-subunit amino acid transport system substrate-binding protein
VVNSLRSGSLRVGACLSLTGRYARFGTQAAQALSVWAQLDRRAVVTVADDHSDPDALAQALPGVAGRCDVLLGPYSTGLMRVAGRLAARDGWVLWNHGGAGDDVTAAHLGHVVSILSPARDYAEPFTQHLAATRSGVPLWIAHGPGRFGRHVAAGAEASARRLGLRTARLDHPAGPWPVEPWDLFCAGSFEEDVALVRGAQAASRPPRVVGAVAAGVREFGSSGVNPSGVYGVGQWFPGSPGLREPGIGPAEEVFLAAYAARYGAVPDYPAVQAVAAAALAAHCLRQAGPDDLWAAALALDASTLFGRFRIRPADGRQMAHRTVLVHWDDRAPVLVQM